MSLREFKIPGKVQAKQIVELKVRKYYGVEPYVYVKLIELEG